MRKVYSVILLVIFCEYLIATSYPQMSSKTRFGDWQHSDVLVIDPVDSRTPGSDIIAVLSQFNQGSLWIRIDLLALEIEQEMVLYVYFDSKPGGKQINGPDELQKYNFRWDYLMQYDASEQISILNDKGVDKSNVKLRISRDLIQNYFEIALGVKELNIDPSTSRIIVVISSSDSLSILDHTDAILLENISPSPIELSIRFWNIMDSSSPATILRSWAGAHTGPQSSRHGLSYLLNASSTWQTPIILCGLYDQDVVLALNYLNAWSSVNKLIYSGLLAPSQCDVNVYAQQANIYIEVNKVQPDIQKIISLALLQYDSGDHSQFTLGGDFTTSALGTPEFVNELFAYFAAHPWIKISNHQTNSTLETGFRDSPTLFRSNSIPYTVLGAPIPSGLTTLEIMNHVSAELASLPQNKISDLSRVMFNNFQESNKPNVVAALGNYISQIGHLIEAANWADRSKGNCTCDLDVDWDGQPECILSTENIFLSFELEGGYLSYGFINNSTGVHQIIGPSTQFNILRSDPSQVNITRGIASDSGQILGAFSDSLATIQLYKTIESHNSIRFVSHDGNYHKTFSIQGENIHIVLDSYTNQEQLSWKLPIVLDPWLSYPIYSDIRYWESSLENHWVWGAGNKVSISINSNVNLSTDTFNATYDALMFPEDPNFDYTAGHLLPIPMALVEFQSNPTIIIDIYIDPTDLMTP